MYSLQTCSHEQKPVMDLSPPDPQITALDLSKTYNTRTRSRSAAVDLAKKPEWYHRRPAGCGADHSSTSPAASYRTRASSSYGALSSSQPAPPAVRCRDMEQGAEPLSGYMNATLAPRLDLYRDGVHRNLWHQGFYQAEEGASPVPESSGGEESDSGSDVIFLVSSAKEPLLCSSFIQDGVRHIVEPLSPAVSSLDESRSCYHLPQPLSSPSPDSSYSEDSSDSSVDIPVHHARPVVLISDLAAMYTTPPAADASSEDDSDVVEVAVSDTSKKQSCEKMENHAAPREVRRSSRIRKSSSDTSPLGCIRPRRSGTRHSLRRQAKNDAVGIYNESGDSDDLMEFVVRASSSDESLPRARPVRRVSDTSAEDAPAEPPRTRSKASCGPSDHLTQNCVPEAKKPRRSEEKQTNRVTPAQQKSPPSKKKPAARRRAKRRRQTAASGPFGPQEPEIQLRFAKPKEESRKKVEDFCPFIRMERRTCVVVNYQEDEGDASRGRWPSSSLSSFVPNTSCFRLGRLGSEGRGPASPLCCLCGYSANAMGLGDLHGPYCLTRTYTDAPNGKHKQEWRHCSLHRSNEGGAESPLHGEQRVESCRCSSSCVVSSTDKDIVEVVPNGAGRPTICTSSPAGDTGSPPEGTRTTPNGAGIPDSTGSPPGGATCPRVKVPLHPEECWIHEDCGIWSAGIFLVRGRLYGLEEAARLAQETVCFSCQQTGAILGCFQKSCCRNYHYRCAVQSGCVLNEENFSMRCPEHKIKPSTKQQPR